ncbi:baseplate assembly protein [Nostocaceae cyanobacterium CENA369]|uniref:Baseplate assembly protein n=1 Tax=Dendronalium phyllosphericum CENA369 TaxID=1725256 RepID=A0A8J7IP46_9NOST|nr:phage baseplate assembly protein V [Dendronalium phyllosphericum]MBH8578157.1 baseplate assembly protein [Dendronalium phyllosphericum CENA369]
MNQPKLDICGSINPQRPSFYGKYRGVVFDNNDPWQLGRVQAKVQEIFGNDPSGWALPCVPYAGKGIGLFLIPPKGALVWMEFENGDPDYPIWSGCFWADEKVPNIVPANPYDPDIKVLKTDIGKIEINDKSGKQSITIEAKIGKQTMKIVINNSGIEIDNGKNATIKLSGKTVSINNTDLEVT